MRANAVFDEPAIEESVIRKGLLKRRTQIISFAKRRKRIASRRGIGNDDVAWP
jgi:hypothetical protein